MREKTSEQLLTARCLVILGVVLFAVNFSVASSHLKQESVSPQVIEVPKEQARHQAYLAERDAELDRRIVQKVAQETLITDLTFAKLVSDALEDSASEFDVDPWLLVSLIRVESAGNPNAVSKVGALGLMQIMPATGKQIAADLGIEWTGPEMLFDPVLNIRMGTYYLSHLLAIFHGNLHAALAAYNWGPGHIRDRITQRRKLPVEYARKILGRLPEAPPWAS
jgi:soluble lytic murein transglycosylase